MVAPASRTDELVVPAFVVDNSVVVAWAYPRQATTYTEALLERSGGSALYTAFIWPAEFANATHMLVNRGLLSEELGAEMLVLAESFGLLVERAPAPGRIYKLSRQHRLSAYDAAYLELATRMSIPLATRDTALKAAAESMGLYLAP
ncbi:MAG: type II toxin-antitoxin system VapC family toxin [Sulfurisoma sp.]|nr:type II toxin-antitoxin system VapC family toxin [Sulfurisoma sp.]